MAAINGTTGTISLGTAIPAGLVALASRWSADLTRETADVTPFDPGAADDNARVNIGGLQTMSGTAEGFLDSAVKFVTSVFDTDGAAAEFVLTASTGRTYTFQGIVTGFSPSAEVGVPNSWTCSFVSDGPIVVA